MSKFIGKAVLKYGLVRGGNLIQANSLVDCTQEELDGGYFDPKTLVLNKKKPEKKMMGSPMNKSIGTTEKRDK